MRLLTILLFLSALTKLPAQIWNQDFNTDSKSTTSHVTPLDDSTFLALAHQLSPDRTILKKMNLYGETLAEDTIEAILVHGLVALQGGGLMCVGSIPASFSDTTIVMKLDEGMQIEWKNKMHRGRMMAIAKSVDGHFYIGGSKDTNSFEDAAYIGKMNSSGNMLWSRTHQLSKDSEVLEIVPLANNQLLLIGTSNGAPPPGGMLAIRVHSSNGAMISTKLFHQGFCDNGNFQKVGIATDQEGNVIVAYGGAYASINGHKGSSLVKFNSSGIYYETTQLTMSSFYERVPTAIHIDEDGNYILFGGNARYGELTKPYIEKMAPNGKVLWSKRAEGKGAITSAFQTIDGSFIIGGMKNSDVRGSLVDDGRGFVSHLTDELNFYPTQLRGKVFYDLNDNCQLDSNEVGLKNWNLSLNGEKIIHTDANGFFSTTLNYGDYFLSIVVDQPIWEACLTNAFFQLSDTSQLAEVYFPLQKRKACHLLNVSVTQPELVPCDTAVYYITWENRGNESAQDATISVEIDDYLDVIATSSPYVLNNEKLEFHFSEIPMDSTGIIEIATILDCDAPPFAQHCVFAEISPVQFDCYDLLNNWDGAYIDIAGECVNDTAHFTLHNKGQGQIKDSVFYKIYANGARQITGTIELANDQTATISFPAQGNAITLVAEQTNGSPFRNKPYYSLEGCGTGTNGHFSTGFSNMFDNSNTLPWSAEACKGNMLVNTGNELFPVNAGYGYYHIVNTTAKDYEYNVNVANNSGGTAEEIALEIYPSTGLVPATFRPTAWNHPVEYTVREDGVIAVHSENLSLQEAENFYLRFKISFQHAGYSQAGIAAKAFFPENESVEISDYFYSILNGYEAQTVSPLANQKEIMSFGRGDALDFINGIGQDGTGNIYLVGTSRNFQDGNFNLLIKTDSTGQLLWQKVIEPGDVFFVLNNIVVSPTGETFVIGGIRENDEIGYITNYRNAILKFDQDGELIWIKDWVNSSGGGGYFRRGIIASDGNLVVFGYLSSASGSSRKNSLWKIAPDGEVLWETEFFGDETAFFKAKLTERTNGNFLLGGIPASPYFDGLFLFSEIGPDGAIVQQKEIKVNNQPTNFGCTNYTLNDSDGVTLACAEVFQNIWGEYNSTPHLVKFNQNFGQVWDAKPFGQFLTTNPIFQDIEYHDGYYYTAANFLRDTTLAGEDLQLTKLATNMSIIWQKNYDTNAREYADELFYGLNNRLWMTAQTQTADYLYDLQVVVISTPDRPQLVGVEDPSLIETKKLDLFPNPAHHYIDYSLAENNSGQIEWALLDYSGKTIADGHHDQPTRINIKDLAKGFYLLKIVTNIGEIYMGKVIIQ